MTGRAHDLLNKYLDDSIAVFKASEARHESFFKTLETELLPFFKAVEKFGKTGEVDVDALRIDVTELNNEVDQENAGPKKGGRRKKMDPLTQNSSENIEEVKVKKEKISEVLELASAQTSISSTTSSINVKVEKDEMPAPNWIPPKKKVREIKTERISTRTTRTKGKKAVNASKVRDSDVIVQNATITTINLSDTSEESDIEKFETKESITRSTRTKTRKQTYTQDSGTETDTESTRSTRTKTRSQKEHPDITSEEVKESRSTRTKTLRKGKKVEEEAKGETEESQPEVRSTRTKTIRKGKNTEETSDNNVPNNNNKDDSEAEPTRSTRTKTRKQENNINDTNPKSDNAIPEEVTNTTKSKRIRSDSTDEEVRSNKDRKKSKSGSPIHDNQGNTTTQTVYEDARSTLGPSQGQLNSTFVTTKPTKPHVASGAVPPVPPLNSTITLEPKKTSAANSTVVVDHPKYNIFDTKSPMLFTDDDESIEVTSPKKGHISKAPKEVFSPYAKTTLKKKVEAFEKLQHGREIPIKVTASAKKDLDKPSSIREKAKLFTPSGSKFAPSSCSTSKISRLISYQQNSTSSNDSALGSKSSQKDPRERQRKLLEREQALQKKEAMLQAQTEAKRKQNEEKQLKALHQRKVLEAEKLKQLEMQKQKEERLRQREQEREEYLKQQKLEVEKKRLAQKKKIQEIQAQRQLVQEDQAAAAKIRPIYMVTEPPRLPTEDCYDSDDPDYKKMSLPSWCTGDQSKHMQLAMMTAGEKIKNTLFCRHAQTPDLTQIFEGIDPRKLKRTSSRLWRKPPRYTMMPDLNETKFSDDEELYD